MQYNLIKKYLPQIFASRITEEISISEKTEKAKQEFSKEISNLTFALESKLSSTNDIDKIKESIRSILKEEFFK
jgi:hypothetical protein